MLQGTVPEAARVIKHLILLMMDQPVRNMQRKTVNVKNENKSVSSWKRNKEFINDARPTKYKQINIYLQGPPKFNHRTLPTLPSPLQGTALLDFLRVGLQPVSSYLVYSTWTNCIRTLQLWTGFHFSDTTCFASTALAVVQHSSMICIVLMASWIIHSAESYRAPNRMLENATFLAQRCVL